MNLFIFFFKYLPPDLLASQIVSRGIGLEAGLGLLPGAWFALSLQTGLIADAFHKAGSW